MSNISNRYFRVFNDFIDKCGSKNDYDPLLPLAEAVFLVVCDPSMNELWAT